MSSLELRFGADLDQPGAADLLAGLSVARAGSWLALDAEADSSGLRHVVHAPRPVLDTLTSRLRALLPSVRLESGRSSTFRPTIGCRLNASRRHLLLDDGSVEQAAATLLAALTEPLFAHERILLRVVLRPTKAPVLPLENQRPLLGRNRVASRHRGRLQAKYDGRVFDVEVFVFAQASSEERAGVLVKRVLQPLRLAQGQAGRLGARRIHAPTTDVSAIGRGICRGGLLLSAPEVTSLIGWPIGAPRLSGLRLGTAPLLPAPRDLPKDGRQFAISNARETSGRVIAQPVKGALQHTVVVGPTGAGKSTLIANLFADDLKSGRGALVLDVKGDLIDDLLGQIPRHRHRDVILLDPASHFRQPGLRLFPPGSDIDLSADLLLGTFSELFKDSWGVRSAQYFRLGLLTLGACQGATLLDLPRLFYDRPFRAQALAEVDDPHTLAAWRRFDGLSSAEQVQQLSSPMTKLQELIGRRSLRAVLGQPAPKLHFGEVLARGRIVLARLSPGQLGSPATRLLAGMLLWQFFSAVEARSALPIGQRHPYLAYIDEVAAIGGQALPLESLLERARGLGVGLTLSPQALSQLSKPVQAAVLANVGTFVSFRQTGSQEASVAAGALPGVSAEQLMSLDPFEVALRLSLGPGRITPTMTGRTTATPSPVSDPDELRRVAADNWGGDVDEPGGGVQPGEARPVEGSNRRRRGQ